MKTVFAENSTKKLTTAAMIASVYTILCLALGPMGFGLIQFRISEALTILAVFSPTMVIAVTLGCGISNLLGFLMGTNPLVFDVILGTMATGIAGYLSWKLRNYKINDYPFLSVLPPIIINAIIIGGEFTFLESGKLLGAPKLFLVNAGYIGASQLIPCLILGPALVILLKKTGVAARYLEVS